jgi:hypothetical protein
MNKKGRNSILLIVLLLILSGAGIGFYLYNKGPLDVHDSSAIKVSALQLYDAYIKDSAAAQKKYTDKILEVSGEVHDISLNQQQKKIILLDNGSDGAYINCTMEENAENIHATDVIKIKGICSGIGEGDADLGIKGDVYLTRCYIVK